MNISDEAIEASARAVYKTLGGEELDSWDGSWTGISDETRYWFTDTARAALQAAAPLIVAEELDRFANGFFTDSMEAHDRENYNRSDTYSDVADVLWDRAIELRGEPT